MHVSAPLTVVAFAATTQAFAFPQWFDGWLSNKIPTNSMPAIPSAKINAAKGDFNGAQGMFSGARGAFSDFNFPTGRGGQGGQGNPDPTSRPAANPGKGGKGGPSSAPPAPVPTSGRGGRGGRGGSSHIPIPSDIPIPSGGGRGGGKGGIPNPSNIPKPPTGGTDGGCPAVWTQISQDLTGMFLSGGQCNDAARASIRAVFHDCFPDGGCDGSLAIQEELSRSENSPMAPTVNRLAALAKQRGVTVADMIIFAGSHAVATCPGGPITQTFIGRKDATAPAPSGQLPPANVGGDEALQHFQSKGFTATDLGALIGSHSCTKQFNTDPSKAGAPSDDTPGVWDTKYYVETIAKTAPFTFESDTNLVNQADVGPVMKRFAGDKAGWDGAFAPAMTKLGLLGGNQDDMIDCTSALPRAQRRRDVKAAPVNARAI